VGTKQTFREGATISGEYVKVQALKKSNNHKFEPLGEADGIQVISEGGYYLVPIDVITWNSDKWNSDTETPTTDTKAQVEVFDKVPPVVTEVIEEKKILGFTYKQILLVAGLAFVINRLIK
jgi:hypothetical protein